MIYFELALQRESGGTFDRWEDVRLGPEAISDA